MSPRAKENTIRLNVFFNPEVVDKLKDAAAERGLTVSGIIRMIVMDWLRGHGRE